MAFKVFRKVLEMLDVNASDITDGQVLAWDDATSKFLAADNGAGGGAPSDATYIVQTADAGLSAEQALGSLATGIVKNTTTTGVLSIAAEGTDYYKPGGTDVALADGGTGASTAAGARTNLGLVIDTDIPSETTFNDHSARHENGGGDEISVAGLSGLLADAQTPTAHATSHQNGGTDEISIAGLDGTSTALQAHLDDTADAHDASAISVLDTAANFTGTDVETVLAELQTNIDNASGTGAPTDATYIVQTANGSLSAEQALGALATGILKNTTTTGVLSIATEGTDYTKPGGTDVALADGGTGASLADPNADRIMFWDDSAGAVDWLTAGTGLSITGTTLSASGGGGGTRQAAVTLTNPQVSANAGNAFYTTLGLTDWDAGHWEFVKDVDGKVYGIVKVPPDYTSGGALKLSIAANATTGVTRLGVGTKAVADGESLNPTLTDETKQDITVPATAYLRKVVSFTLTETLAASDLLIVEIFHEGSHVNDTLAVNTLLFGAWLEYTA